MERGWKPNVESSPTCPRCGSSNTKFCYYNNYCLTQPRYFCKGCRRYWTKGGSLRNVPIGGGCRKSRRGKPIRVSSDSLSSRFHHGNNHLAESSTSIRGPEGPNIDLATVYANFVNQKPQINDDNDDDDDQKLEIPQFLNNGLFPSFDQFSSVQNMHLNSLNNGVLECDGNGVFSCGLDSILENHHQFTSSDVNYGSNNNNNNNNYVLPPLPGEELVVSEEMVWPPLPADVMLHHHQMLNVTHSLSGLEPEAALINQNPVINGNESSLSNYDFSGLGK